MTAQKMMARADWDKSRVYGGVEEELNKELVVVAADAVADPGAVVVHAVNADAAKLAVVGAHRLDAVALEAVADAGKRLDFVARSDNWVQLHVGDLLLADGPLDLLLLAGSLLDLVDVQEAVVLRQVLTHDVL